MKKHRKLKLFFSPHLWSFLCILLAHSILWGQLEERDMNLSTNFECEAPTLKIKTFKDKMTGKTNQIVVGRPIEYKAKLNGGTDFQWGIGDLEGDDFTPFWDFTSTMAEGTTTIAATAASLSPNNADFGVEHGTVRVTASLDGEMQEAIRDVKLYYQKDEINPHSSNGDINWFYYWSQIELIIPELEIPGIKLFNVETCSFDPNPTPLVLALNYDGAGMPYVEGGLTQFGANQFEATTMDTQDPSFFCEDMSSRRVTTGYNELARVDIGEGCGIAKKSPADPSVQLKGIHVFYSTLIHEIEHANIVCEIWTDGYDSTWDSDRDGYRDTWEIEEAPVTPSIMFMVGPDVPDDAYNPEYNPDLLNQVPPLYSAGTEYEEGRCREKEKNLINNSINNINSFDWSFDPTNVAQGKNW